MGVIERIEAEAHDKVMAISLKNFGFRSALVVAKMGASIEAREKLVKKSLQHGQLEIAQEAVKLLSRGLERKEYEVVVKFHVRKGETAKAIAVAEKAGRKLRPKEAESIIKALIDRVSHRFSGDLAQISEALEFLNGSSDDTVNELTTEILKLVYDGLPEEVELLTKLVRLTTNPENRKKALECFLNSGDVTRADELVRLMGRRLTLCETTTLVEKNTHNEYSCKPAEAIRAIQLGMFTAKTLDSFVQTLMRFVDKLKRAPEGSMEIFKLYDGAIDFAAYGASPKVINELVIKINGDNPLKAASAATRLKPSRKVVKKVIERLLEKNMLIQAVELAKALCPAEQM